MYWTLLIKSKGKVVYRQMWRNLDNLYDYLEEVKPKYKKFAYEVYDHYGKQIDYLPDEIS